MSAPDVEGVEDVEEVGLLLSIFFIGAAIAYENAILGVISFGLMCFILYQIPPKEEQHDRRKNKL